MKQVHMRLIAILVMFCYLAVQVQACPASRANFSRAPVGVSILDGAIFRSASVLRQLGVRAVRAEIHWSLVEAAPGRTDWTQIDALFADTDALNLEVLALYLEVGSRAREDVTTCSDTDMKSANADGRFVHKDGTAYPER